ncbi:MAG: TRAP transporter substrate-binding protein DctP [Polyangiaceae bacterium]
MKEVRMVRKVLAMLAVLVVFMAASAPARADGVTLKFGTLAPGDSTWGHVFKIWQKGLSARTNGAVSIQWFWNGQQGDETSMVGRIRTGQLDGAAITASGLAQIYKQSAIFQIPNMFSSWAKLDQARDKMRPQFDAEYEKAGFKNLGSGDVGAVHLMTKGFEVRTPNDLKHRNTFYITGDSISPILYALVGDNTPKSIGVNEVNPDLSNSSVNVVNAPCLVAEQLQWAPQLDHINRAVAGYAIGSIVMSNAKLKSLPADAQTAITETGAIAAKALTTSIRAADDAAFLRLAGDGKGTKGRMTDYTPTDAEQAQWKALFDQTRSKLRGGTFNADIMDQITAAAK